MNGKLPQATQNISYTQIEVGVKRGLLLMDHQHVCEGNKKNP
jgi:hypothetical protein